MILHELRWEVNRVVVRKSLLVVQFRFKWKLSSILSLCDLISKVNSIRHRPSKKCVSIRTFLWAVFLMIFNCLSHSRSQGGGKYMERCLNFSHSETSVFFTWTSTGAISQIAAEAAVGITICTGILRCFVLSSAKISVVILWILEWSVKKMWMTTWSSISTWICGPPTATVRYRSELISKRDDSITKPFFLIIRR